MRRIAWLLALATAVAAQEAPVVVAPVVEREVAAGRSFVGTVEPARESTVGSEVDGLVTKLLVREGDHVKQGQELALLRTKLLEIRLDAARAQLDLRQQELAEQQNGARPDEKEQARARLEEAKLTVELREWKLASGRRLFESKSISEDELKELEITLERARELLKDFEARKRLVDAGPRAEKIAQAKARLAQQEAEVDRLEDELKRHTIRAPFDGYVVEEHTEAGQWVSKGEAVVRIVALDEVDITVPVLEDYIAGVKRGLEVTVSVDAARLAPVIGKVSKIVPSADRSSHTFPVKVRLKNPDLTLKAGMFARIQLAVGEKQKAMLVPKDALVLGGPSPMVYVVGPDQTAMPVPVELGIAVDGHIQVTGPLKAGQQVVIRGNERLRPGQKVRISK